MEEEVVGATEVVTLPEVVEVMVVAMTEAVADMAMADMEVEVADDLVVAEEDMVEDPRTTTPLAVEVGPSSRQTERWMLPMRQDSRMLWRKSRVI